MSGRASTAVASESGIHLPVHATHVASRHGVAAVSADATEVLDLLPPQRYRTGCAEKDSVDYRAFMTGRL